MLENNKVFLIGYSGHAYVVCDILHSMGINPIGYFDNEEKIFNPYSIKYFGSERSEKGIELLKKSDYFVAIGDNQVRSNIILFLTNLVAKSPINIMHKNASVSSTSILGNGIMLGDGAIVNACSEIGDGVICNTQSVIEHECKIGAYSHVAPGAVLCGNVKIGSNSFIGARSVVKEGVTIGDNVIIGAGTVVIRDIPSDSKVVGNPQKNI